MTSRTPVYVATGFLDAGKTRLLNGVLRRRLAEGVRPLVLQFESGEEALLPLPSSGASAVSFHRPARRLRFFIRLFARRPGVGVFRREFARSAGERAVRVRQMERRRVAPAVRTDDGGRRDHRAKRGLLPPCRAEGDGARRRVRGQERASYRRLRHRNGVGARARLYLSVGYREPAHRGHAERNPPAFSSAGSVTETIPSSRHAGAPNA